MIIQCAWCRKEMEEKPPYEDKSVTHGICEECRAKYFSKIKAKQIAEDSEGLEMKDDIKMNLLLRYPNMGYQEIANIAGCSRQRVYQVAKRAGLTRDTKPRRYRSDITVERVLKFYHQGLLVKDIAKALSGSVATVRSRLRAVGITKSQCYSRSMKLDWRGDPKIRAQMT